jgi:FlaA1/EpsC-like NDP-sugar epimerase
MGSRGSVIPFFLSLEDGKPLPITDTRMTRFMITLEQGVELVWQAFDDMVGGEIYVKKIPSMTITEIANATRPGVAHNVIGIRPGEKLHEQMIGPEDSAHTFEYDDYFKIIPAIHNWSQDPARIKGGKPVPEDFSYCSDNNAEWMNEAELARWIDANRAKIGQF